MRQSLLYTPRRRTERARPLNLCATSLACAGYSSCCYWCSNSERMRTDGKSALCTARCSSVSGIRSHPPYWAAAVDTRIDRHRQTVFCCRLWGITSHHSAGFGSNSQTRIRTRSSLCRTSLNVSGFRARWAAGRSRLFWPESRLRGNGRAAVGLFTFFYYLYIIYILYLFFVFHVLDTFKNFQQKIANYTYYFPCFYVN